MFLQLSQIFPFAPSTWDPHFLQQPPLSSCPWVLHIRSLVTPLPILFLTTPYLLCTYQSMLLNLYTLLPIFPFPFPANNPPNDLHVSDSVPVLFVCFVCYLDSSIDNCKFIAILMFIILIFFFFLYNSLYHFI